MNKDIDDEKLSRSDRLFSTQEFIRRMSLPDLAEFLVAQSEAIEGLTENNYRYSYAYGNLCSELYDARREIRKLKEKLNE